MRAAFTIAAFCLLTPSQASYDCGACIVTLDHRAYPEVPYHSTSNEICAYARNDDGEDVKDCLDGSGNDYNGYTSIFRLRKRLDKQSPIYISISGSDAMWIDTVTAWWSKSPQVRRTFGIDNRKGWCLSTDHNDISGFDGKTSSGDSDSAEGSAWKCRAVIRLCPCGGTVEYVDYTSSSYSFSKIHNQSGTSRSCTAYSQAACELAAASAGLQAGHPDWPFAGDYGTKGCYAYTRGEFEGYAFYGTGGYVSDMKDVLDSPKTRPIGWNSDCRAMCAGCAEDDRRRLAEDEVFSTDALRLLEAEA